MGANEGVRPFMWMLSTSPAGRTACSGTLLRTLRASGGSFVLVGRRLLGRLTRRRGECRCTAEQVSHHPPVSAWHCEDPGHVQLYGSVSAAVKFSFPALKVTSELGDAKSSLLGAAKRCSTPRQEMPN